MQQIQRIATATRDAVEEIDRFLEVVGAASGRHQLGESKRSQIRPGVSRWTGLLAWGPHAPLGYAHVRWTSRDNPVAAAEVVLAADADEEHEVGLLLLDEVRRVVAEAGGGKLHVWAHHVEDPATTLPAAAGLAVARSLAVMRIDVPETRTVSPPPGIEIRPYRPGSDDAALIAVNNAAFAGHPEQGGWDATILAERTRLAWFDPEGLLLAWRGDTLLGFHWTKVHPGPRPVGEVYVLGIGPEAQGLGLGRLLLDAGLRRLHELGCRRVILYVDRANEAAYRLYASAGFEVAYWEVCYEEVVRPAT